MRNLGGFRDADGLEEEEEGAGSVRWSGLLRILNFILLCGSPSPSTAVVP